MYASTHWCHAVAAVDAWWGSWNWGRQHRIKAIWWDLHLAILLTHLFNFLVAFVV